MTLSGWTLPQSPTGRSALLVPPPWHYSGDLFVVGITVDPGAAQAFMPPGLVADPDGRATITFADWRSSADHDDRIGGDPAIGQYHEAFWTLNATRGDQPVGRVPFIYVDSELSLIRGHIQGFPKKLADVAMSRAVTVGRGGPRLEPGGRFTGHVSRHGHRLLQATISLDDLDQPGAAGGGQLVHTRLFPSIDLDAPAAVHELTTVTSSDFELGAAFTGTAEVHVGDSPFDEVALLRPTSVDRGTVMSFAFSVVGGTVEPLSEEP